MGHNDLLIRSRHYLLHMPFIQIGDRSRLKDTNGLTLPRKALSGQHETLKGMGIEARRNILSPEFDLGHIDKLPGPILAPSSDPPLIGPKVIDWFLGISFSFPNKFSNFRFN